MKIEIDIPGRDSLCIRILGETGAEAYLREKGYESFQGGKWRDVWNLKGGEILKREKPQNDLFLFKSQEDFEFFEEQVQLGWYDKVGRYIYSFNLDREQTLIFLEQEGILFENLKTSTKTGYLPIKLKDKRILELDMWRGESLVFQTEEDYKFIKTEFLTGPLPVLAIGFLLE